MPKGIQLVDNEFVKIVTELVGSIGVPGALLLVLAWSWVKAQPLLFKFFESVSHSLETLAHSQQEIREDIREIKMSLLAKAP